MRPAPENPPVRGAQPAKPKRSFTAAASRCSASRTRAEAMRSAATLIRRSDWCGVRSAPSWRICRMQVARGQPVHEEILKLDRVVGAVREDAGAVLGKRDVIDGEFGDRGGTGLADRCGDERPGRTRIGGMAKLGRTLPCGVRGRSAAWILDTPYRRRKRARNRPAARAMRDSRRLSRGLARGQGRRRCR